MACGAPTPVFDQLTGLYGLAYGLGSAKVEVRPFGEGEPWLVAGRATEALEGLWLPHAEVLWLERGGAAALRALGHADLVAATARSLRTGRKRHLASEPVTRGELVGSLRAALGAEAPGHVDQGLAKLAREPRPDVCVVRGCLRVDVCPLPPWVERLAAGRSQSDPERAPPLLGPRDLEAEGELLAWAMSLLVQVEAHRLRGAPVGEVERARAEALFWPMVRTLQVAVRRKARRFFKRHGQRFSFRCAPAGKLPDDLPQRAVERAITGLARGEARAAFSRLCDPAAPAADLGQHVVHAVLTGLDQLREEGLLVPEVRLDGSLEGLGGHDEGEEPRSPAFVALPNVLLATDLASFVEATPGSARDQGEEREFALGLVKRVRARATRLLRWLRRRGDGRLMARCLDLLTLLDRGTIATATQVPFGTIRSDLGPRSDPSARGPDRFAPGMERPVGRRAAPRRLPCELRGLLPRELRRFDEAGNFARVYGLVRFCLLPDPDEVVALARSELARQALEGLFFWSTAFDRRSKGCPSWRARDLEQARVDAGLPDVLSLVRDLLLPFVLDLLEHRAGRALTTCQA